MRSESQVEGFEVRAGSGSDNKVSPVGDIGNPRRTPLSKVQVGALVISVGVHGFIFWFVNGVLEEEHPPNIVIPIELVEWQRPGHLEREPELQPRPKPEDLDERALPTNPDRFVSEQAPHYKDDDRSQDMPAFRLRTLLKEASCPKFIDPQDQETMDRCGRSQDLEPGSSGTAQRFAEAQINLARKRGWTIAELKRFEDLEFAEGQSAMPAPATEVFGPWAWEE